MTGSISNRYLCILIFTAALFSYVQCSWLFLTVTLCCVDSMLVE